MRNLCLSVLFFLIGGCAATGIPFAPEKDTNESKAIVYVYRPALSINCCVAPYVLVNNEKRGQLKNGGYLSFAVDPGPISIEAVNETVGFKSLKLTLDGKAGQSYFLRWAAAATMGWNPLPYGSEEEKKKASEKPGGEFFSTQEAKKREQENAKGTLGDVQRATDRDSALQSSALFAIDHEREMRVVDSAVALKEIARTKKSD